MGRGHLGRPAPAAAPGEDVSSDLASMRRLKAVAPQGGFVQTSAGSRSPPYEFHVWPAVGGTAWPAIVTGDPVMIWTADR